MSKKTVPMEVYQGGGSASEIGIADTHAMPPDRSMTRPRARPQPQQPTAAQPQPAPRAPTPAQPTHVGHAQWVGRFRIVEQLGAGAAGIVFRAHDPHLDRMVAVKLLHAQSRAAGAHDERLLREAKGLARVTHPNVVTVHDVGVHAGQLFVAMELVEGTTLTDWLAQPHDWREVLEVMIAAGRGLHAIHQAGLVHRDFKPDNVLIDAHGRARIADFGLVRAADDPELAHDEADYNSSPLGPAMTRTGALMGTPAFMAPEQLQRRGADARSDQFGFCVTLYEALYRQPPFVANTIGDQLRATTSGAVQPVAGASPIPRAIHAVIMKGLSPAPEMRYPDMAAVVEGLEAAGGGSAGRSSRLGLWLGLSGAALVLLLAGAGWAYYDGWLSPPGTSGRSSKAAAKALKKARAELDRAEYAACSKTAADGPRTEKLIDVWLTCALQSDNWDHAARACKAWDKHGDGHTPTSCDPVVVKAYGLMTQQKWRACLDVTSKDSDPNKHNLAVQLVCAHHASDDVAYVKACKAIKDKFPAYGAAEACDPNRGSSASGTATPSLPPHTPAGTKPPVQQPPSVPKFTPPKPVPRHKPTIPPRKPPSVPSQDPGVDPNF